MTSLSCTVSKLSQIIVQILDEKRPLSIFEPPLGSTYTVYLRLIGIEKLAVEFLFVLIELYRYGVTVIPLRRYERILIGNRGF